MSNINKKIRYTWGAKICIALFLVGCTAQIYLPNNVGKSTRYTWGAKIFIALILVGCAASVYALAKVMMEGL